MKKLLFIGIVTLAAATQSGWAQVTAVLSGRVVDATDAGIPGATVTVKTVETGATRSTTTDESGTYKVVALPVGPQEVRAEKTGFKAAVRLGINLAVGQEAVANLRLEVGTVSEQVTVVADTALVNTSTASISGLVNERQIKELPLNGRSFDNLMTLNPGIVSYVLKSPSTSTSNGNTFTVAGRRPMENVVLLNGIEYSGTSQLAITPGGVSGDLLGIDAVREFNVLTDTYGAEYGKRAGGQVTVVTQSGTNALHGSLFEFLRNSALDARGTFDQGPAPPPFRRNQFGGSLGGPLKKDKLFLFGNYEGFRQSLATSSVSVVPDELARQGALPNATTGVYSPVVNLNPAILKYMALWPDPNGPELLLNGLPTGAKKAFYNPKNPIREDFGTARSDYYLREHDTLSASYTVDDGNSVIPLGDPLFASALKLRNQVTSLEETHVFSPRLLNTFRAGYSRSGFNYDSYSTTAFPSNLSFVTGYGPGGIVIGGAQTTTGSAALTAAGPSNNANVWNRRNLYTFSDGVSITTGKHQINAGVWFQRLQDNENVASRQLGVATFASLTTFLQGTLTNFQVVPSANTLGWRSLFGAWYVDDTIRLRRNLTVQLGLRHEFTTGWNEVAGRAANYITDGNGILLSNTRVGNSAFTENNAKRLFAPRASIAWDPFGKGKTAIRAGFGIYYSLIDDLAFQLNSLYPYNGTVSYTGTLPPLVPLAPNTPPLQPCGPGIPSAQCAIYAPLGVQPDAKTPTVNEWNFTVEQQIDRNTTVRVAYVGSFGYHQFVSVDPNSIPAQICSNPAGCLAGGLSTSAATRSTVPQGAQYIPVTATRPNPYVSNGFFWYSEGNSSYNALQIDVNRRLTRGFQLRANYTWSKNLDHNSALTIAQAANQPQMVMDPRDLRRDWGPSALNVTHQASISAHYDLPFGDGKTGITNKLIGGWQLNEITTLLSGFPFTPQIGLNRSGDGDTRNPDRPNLNPAFTGPVVTGNPNQWFDPNAFTPPPYGTFGSLGRGVFDGPGLAEVDLSVLKNIPVTERVNLQFRAEFFNLLNRANYASPNQTVFTNTGSAVAPVYSINPSAGLITSLATTPRQIQFGLKLMF
ncbi:MAG: TonB-dependent receptor [Bryobacterales bacterium]|nr:TonB-dependent receptor [Bryobacterales bacterium]